ncbi:carbamoyl-phosphate synthase large subunit [Paenibacillus taihuensis]|uniref:Carbamoyl-phosphate synthase large subunit n=1 Tax=Paenibacillus taihuensis TaxID=1156355 RepID=A0A3D9SI42_9BACL|nr:ATP-grasp domain-containing protein [Paenibacillus taihuensis]REE91548.1 carbamoyl-phosphate synthase large subunit [Paenibacillus taihuensis]
MKPIVRILLTGAGSPAAPGVIQSLRNSEEYKFHIVGVDCNPLSTGFHMADLHYIGPRASDEQFIPFIEQVCRNERIDVLFSLVTDELIKLSEHREVLSQMGTHMNLSAVPVLRNVINKGMLYNELQKMGIAVPAFQVTSSAEQFEKALTALGYPEQPVCFKPTISDGSRGFHILDDHIDRFELLFRHKPTSVYVSHSELLRVIQGRKEFPEVLVMEYLPHEEYSVDVLAENGKAMIAVPRLREATIGGISTKSLIRKDQDIIDYAVEVVERLGLQGNIGIQIRRDRSRQPKIVEINPRMQGTIVHCTAAGINLPVLGVKQALGVLPMHLESTVIWGTRMVRHWKEVFYHADGSSYTL